jgi:hypothetical protein
MHKYPKEIMHLQCKLNEFQGQNTNEIFYERNILNKGNDQLIKVQKKNVSNENFENKHGRSLLMYRLTT